MAVPEQTHSGNLNKSKIVAQPSAGARQGAGKSSEADANLQYCNKQSEEVKTIDMSANADGHHAAARQQLESNMPKDRVQVLKSKI